MTVTAEVKGKAGELAELVKQVQAGNEVLLTQDAKPVARLVSAVAGTATTENSFRVSSFKGRKILTPIISQSDLAGEMFGRI